MAIPNYVYMQVLDEIGLLDLPTLTWSTRKAPPLRHLTLHPSPDPSPSLDPSPSPSPTPNQAPPLRHLTLHPSPDPSPNLDPSPSPSPSPSPDQAPPLRRLTLHPSPDPSPNLDPSPSRSRSRSPTPNQAPPLRRLGHAAGYACGRLLIFGGRDAVGKNKVSGILPPGVEAEPVHSAQPGVPQVLGLPSASGAALPGRQQHVRAGQDLSQPEPAAEPAKPRGVGQACRHVP
eukprot:scaffold26721_cov45-Phaeocystis_antarctica.AAC.1